MVSFEFIESGCLVGIRKDTSGTRIRFAFVGKIMCSVVGPVKFYVLTHYYYLQQSNLNWNTKKCPQAIGNDCDADLLADSKSSNMANWQAVAKPWHRRTYNDIVGPNPMHPTRIWIRTHVIDPLTPFSGRIFRAFSGGGGGGGGR